MTKTATTAPRSRAIVSRLERCPACLVAWRSSDTIRVPFFQTADEMLAGGLDGLLHELRYERCSACSSLIATDERRDPELLDEIYRNLPDSYWSQLNPQNVLRRHDRPLSCRPPLHWRSVGCRLWVGELVGESQ